MAEAQVQAQSPKHPPTGGEDEQPHTVGGYYHSLSEGKSALKIKSGNGTIFA